MAGIEQETAEPEKRLRWRAWLADLSPVAVVTWLGVFAYFVTRSGQTSFYSRFGVEPEDVGLGYAETLSRAAVGLLLILLVAGTYSLFLALVPRFILGVRPAGLGTFARSVVGFLLVALPILLLWMPHTYSRDAARVRDGKSMRPAGLSTPRRIITNPLGLRVEPVRVSWIDETHAVYDFGRTEVMYLGRADGTAVFYDPRSQRTVRVPENNIVIERNR